MLWKQWEKISSVYTLTNLSRQAQSSCREGCAVMIKWVPADPGRKQQLKSALWCHCQYLLWVWAMSQLKGRNMFFSIKFTVSATIFKFSSFLPFLPFCLIFESLHLKSEKISFPGKILSRYSHTNSH